MSDDTPNLVVISQVVEHPPSFEDVLDRINDAMYSFGLNRPGEEPLFLILPTRLYGAIEMGMRTNPDAAMMLCPSRDGLSQYRGMTVVVSHRNKGVEVLGTPRNEWYRMPRETE